jgi:hypothetical protein
LRSSLLQQLLDQRLYCLQLPLQPSNLLVLFCSNLLLC